MRIIITDSEYRRRKEMAARRQMGAFSEKQKHNQVPFSNPPMTPHCIKPGVANCTLLLRPNLFHCLSCTFKFYRNTDTAICWYIVYNCFLATRQSLNSCSRKLIAGEAKNIYYLAFYGKKKKPADFQNKGLSPNPIWNIKHLWSTLIWQDLSTQNESSVLLQVNPKSVPLPRD